MKFTLPFYKYQDWPPNEESKFKRKHPTELQALIISCSNDFTYTILQIKANEEKYNRLGDMYKS